MKKTIFLILTALLLTTVVFAGGGGQQAGTSGSSSAAALNEAGFRETGYPIVTKPYTLRAHGSSHQNTPPWENLEIFKKIERRTGIQIRWDYTGADWATQKALLLASGDLPDMFVGRTVLNETDVITNKELFVPMDDLIAKYGPNVQAMFRDDPGMERMARAYDGKIYGLPMKMPYRPVTFQVWGINSNWLNKLNLKMPTTTDELYTVLKAFKERDPNGNGIADEIPATFLGSDFGENWGLNNFLCAFGVVTSGDHWLSVTNGKVQFIVAQEGFRDAVAYLHKLYSEGLLDQELFTQNRNMMVSKADPPPGQPEIVGLGGRWGRNFLFGEERSESHYPLVLPLKGPKGHQYWSYNPETAQSGKYSFEITRNCRLPEIAMRWGDLLYEQSTSLDLFYGPEGTSWRSNPNGTIVRLAPPAGFTGDWGWAFSTNDRAPGYTSDRVSNSMIQETLSERQQFEDKKLFAPYYPKEWWPPVSMTPDELNELAILRTDIVGPSRTKYAEWITRGGVEREYDAWVRQLNTMGLQRMLQIYQTAYDRYMKK